jgi:hypothetical protein
MKTIRLKSGDTPTIKLTAKDANKNVVDITGYGSASLKIAKTLGITNNNALYYVSVLAASFSDGVNGVHSFVIPEDTTKDWEIGDYLYQVRLIDSANTVTSTDTGVLIVEENLIDDEI